MKVVHVLAAACALTFLAAFAAAETQANYRQYYGGWSYYPQRSYYYRYYYYKPTADYVGYQYHYAVYYPAQPRYVYYYNPYKRYYWGRCDLQGKPGEQYSLLKEEDRKARLEDIPESAFPKPAEMPLIPDSTDGERVAVPDGVPQQDLPGADAATPQPQPAKP